MSRLYNALPELWPSFDLPNVRPHPETFRTYSGFPFKDLPSVAADADERFLWLKEEPEKKEWSLRDWNGEVGRLAQSIQQKLVETAGINPPESSVRFLRSPDLQARVRSCTACYLELPEYIVPVAGTEKGYLLHFLSDQQWCLHWSLYFDQAGEEFVICSEAAYGFEDEEEQPFSESNPVDLVTEGVIVCAPSFTEFMYRFWIENEIWFNSTDGVPLTAKQQAYLERYKSEQD